MRIFVVEDNPKWEKIIKEAVGLRGAEIEIATSAELAVKRLGEENANFDKVICDGLSGEWETVHKAVQECGLPILLWSADKNILDTAAEKGVPGLAKRAPLRELLNTIFPPTGSVETK